MRCESCGERPAWHFCGEGLKCGLCDNVQRPRIAAKTRERREARERLVQEFLAVLASERQP